MKRFVVMAGDYYARFASVGHPRAKIRSVKWHAGSLGLSGATKFKSRHAAEVAMAQVNGPAEPLRVVEVTID